MMLIPAWVVNIHLSNSVHCRFENLLGLIGGEETLEKTSKETLTIRF